MASTEGKFDEADAYLLSDGRKLFKALRMETMKYAVLIRKKPSKNVARVVRVTTESNRRQAHETMRTEVSGAK